MCTKYVNCLLLEPFVQIYAATFVYRRSKIFK